MAPINQAMQTIVWPEVCGVAYVTHGCKKTVKEVEVVKLNKVDLNI